MTPRDYGRRRFRRRLALIARRGERRARARTRGSLPAVRSPGARGTCDRRADGAVNLPEARRPRP